jgi:hypothetical protein
MQTGALSARTDVTSSRLILTRPEGGGAVYALQQGRQTAEFANTLFTANRSTQGGSVFQGTAATFVATTIDAAK